MQRNLAILVAFGVMFSVTSCTKKTVEPAAPQPPIVDQQPLGPEWKLTLQSKCTYEAAEDCVGFYGFTVLADGRFEVGPGPANQLQSGSLEEQEFATIKAAVEKLSAAEAQPESCEEQEWISDSEDSINLFKRGAAARGVLRLADANLCFQSATAEEAKALHQAIRELAYKYYALPFPDACTDAASAVTALYAPVQKCQTDAECAFVNESYQVVAPGSLEYVPTDNCSKVAPLVVGNITLVTNAQKALREALEQAQNVCGAAIVRYECTGYTGFSSHEATPVCRQNVCVKAE